MIAIPEWLASTVAARVCADCRLATAETFWHSMAGPALCWSCCEHRLTDAELAS